MTPEREAELRRLVEIGSDLHYDEAAEIFQALDEERDKVKALTEVAEAARLFSERVSEVNTHPSYRGIFILAKQHGMPYNGPSWGNEYIALIDALAYLDNPLIVVTK
jgi:hypothetical protein